MAAKSYTVGSGNTILRRDGHSGPWVDIAPNAPMYANVHWRDVMTFPGNSDKLIVVGDVGVLDAPTGIIVSNDAGATWNTPNGNWVVASKFFTEVWVANDNDIWIVGQEAFVFRSYDGGLTFTNPDPSSNIHKPGGDDSIFSSTFCIHAIDANVAVVAGSPGNSLTADITHVWKTIDGGYSWFDLNLDATYQIPPPPSLKNSQVKGAASFTVVNGGTGYPPFSNNNTLTTQTGIGAGATVNFDSGPPSAPVGVIDSVATSALGDLYEIGDILIVDGGNNDCILEVASLGGGDSAGQAGGIWISDDQQRIIVSTFYTQQLSTDYGNTFSKVGPETPRSGKHLTWYPSYGEPTEFKHTGGPIINIVASTDVGTSWTTERSNDGITIVGAHFYSSQNGYYLANGNIWSTSNGGVTGDVNTYTAAQGITLDAVWTAPDEPENPCYLFKPCDTSIESTIWTGPILAQYLDQIVSVNFVTNSEVPSAFTLCGKFTETTGCDEANPFSPNNSVLDTYKDCETCIGPLPDFPCYDLIPCEEENCNVILGATDADLAQYVGQYVEINGDRSCRYLVTQSRQAYTFNLPHAVLSLPTGNFQLGTDNHTIEITSVIFNNTEYISAPQTPYLLTPSNYGVVECTELVCTPVTVNTTENCITNLPSYFNNVFSNIGLDELIAFCADPSYCEGYPDIFKIQFPDNNTFTITYTVANTAGISTIIITASAGNIIQTTAVSNEGSTTYDFCSSLVQCNGNSVLNYIENVDKQPLTLANAIDVFTECKVIPPPPPPPGPGPGPVPNPIPQPDLGVACETRPRFAEPGFSTKYCNPQQVVDINCKFADSVYALFKRMRYGIETCCEFDLDKIEIKKGLMDLGALYDPDMCIPGQPVPFGCCPQPCDVVADLQIPMFINCPEPIDVTAVISGIPIVPPIPCLAATGVLDNGEPLVVLTFPESCVETYWEITIPPSQFGSQFTITDCAGNIASLIVPPAGGVYNACAASIGSSGVVVNLGPCPPPCVESNYRLTYETIPFGARGYTVTDCEGITIAQEVQPSGGVFEVCSVQAPVISGLPPVSIEEIGDCTPPPCVNSLWEVSVPVGVFSTVQWTTCEGITGSQIVIGPDTIEVCASAEPTGGIAVNVGPCPPPPCVLINWEMSFATSFASYNSTDCEGVSTGQIVIGTGPAILNTCSLEGSPPTGNFTSLTQVGICSPG